MKESIFFNREQLKIIRWYGIFYSILLKYGLFIFAGILSLFMAWWTVSFGYFSETPLWNDASEQKNISKLLLPYQNKVNSLKRFSGLQAKNLYGTLSFLSGHLRGQDVLLVYKDQVLPRQISISSSELEDFIWKDKLDYDDKYFNRFFFSLLKAPLEESFLPQESAFLPLNGSLSSTFWLECLDSASKYSFVCQHYLSQFLDNFYFYQLSSKKIDANNVEDGVAMEESSAFNELQLIYDKIKRSTSQKKAFCQGILRYGDYGGTFDDRLIPLMRSCGGEEYNKFLFLKDFASLSEGFALGFVDTKIYANSYLNHYKLFSLQQLLYKQLSSSVDAKAVMTSYFQFLRELLTRENNRKTELLSQFSKSFSYRYNTMVLAPYLKDEKSKMSKEDRSFLMGQLLSLNYGDKLSNFVGLEEQSHYKNTLVQTGTFQQQDTDIEKLFRSSYLPNGFSLTSLQKIDAMHLLVKGVDRRTSLSIQAQMVYQDIQLSVVEITVDQNQKLTEYLNTLIANNRFSLNKVLTLLNENKDIAQQTQPLNLNLCAQLKEQFKERLLVCGSDKVQIKQESQTDGDSSTIYTFGLTKNVLSSLQVSDKILELKLSKEIDFSTLDATTTAYLIPILVGYQPQEANVGFGMKEHLLVRDKFVKYLWIVPEQVNIEGNVLKVFFKIQDIAFQATYDPAKNELNPIALDFGALRRPVIVQNLKLHLHDEAMEELNAFVAQPLEVLRTINAALVKRYFPENK